MFKTLFDSDKINYIDITSLYPLINKTYYHLLGHPEIIECKFTNISLYCNIIKCKILSHITCTSLFTRPLQMINFFSHSAGLVLLRKIHIPATLKKKGPFLEHGAPWVKQSTKLGYQIIEIYEVWNFKEGTNSLFEKYVETFLKIKQEASGWSQNCETEEDKQAYVKDYFKHEFPWIPGKLKKNSGLRSIVKLCLNLWGKLSQRSNLATVEFVNSPEKFSLFHN